jgi:hypothetical protein
VWRLATLGSKSLRIKQVRATPPAASAASKVFGKYAAAIAITAPRWRIRLLREASAFGHHGQIDKV